MAPVKRTLPGLMVVFGTILAASSVPAAEPASRPRLSPAMPPGASGGSATQPTALVWEKYASKEAIFLLYKPKGWLVTEGAQPGFRTISVADPAGTCEAAMFHGQNPTGDDVLALTKVFVGGIGKQFPDLRLSRTMVSRDRQRVTFSATFTHPKTGKRELRCWVSGQRGDFLYSSIETPAGRLPEMAPVLLTILANVRVFDRAFATGPAPVQVNLVPYRLADGSASFSIPEGWGCRELGKGCFIAADPAGQYAFIVANVDVLTPELGVSVPGVPIAPYQSPSRAMRTLAAAQGFAENMTFETIIPRPDVAEAMAQVYTIGQVLVEEFVYTCDTRAGRTKGYTFGFSLGARLGTNWSFRHLTVMAPAGQFDAFVGNFVTMLQSYRIDSEWAANYVAQGMARLREMQRQTSAMIARNAQEIRQMMQAAYDERQRSMDYIDYQRTNYIRGEQDWISHVEGGTIYHTDSWGTRNTATGDYHEGKPYDYVHYEGGNPKYNEDMTAVDSRALWERYVR